MKILLDIDGVLVTTPAWKKVEVESDGFMAFNREAVENLAFILERTDAEIVLTTTHRVNYPIEQWFQLLNARGLYPSSVSKIDDAAALTSPDFRIKAIEKWVAQNGTMSNYVIIDDDLSLNALLPAIRNHFVSTKPMTGLNREAAKRALYILLDKQTY